MTELYINQNKSHFAQQIDIKEDLEAAGASRAPKVRGGPKAQFCPTFQKIQVLLHFYVTIFLDSQSQGGPRPPWTPWIRGPCGYVC